MRIGLMGQGALPERWRSAAASVANVAPDSDIDTQLDALIVATAGPDAFARAKAALDAGLPVLYAAPSLLSPWQTQALLSVARRRGALLRFAEPFQHHAGFAFLRRLLTGDEPFWRTLYLRSTSLAPAGSGARLDELASEQLAACDALIDRPARRVSSAANRAGEAGVRALFLTIEYEGGPLIHCTVSVAEPASERRLVAVTQGRSIVLDWNDPDSSLCFQGALEHAVHPPPATEISTPDPMLAEVTEFVAAARTGDRSSENGARWAQLAAIWWAARESMGFGETVEVAGRRFLIQNAEPPPLRVIEGGGRVVAPTRRRPVLTVVAG